jgi:hypothetical protein
VKDAFVNAGKGAVTGAIAGLAGGVIGGAASGIVGNFAGSIIGSISGGSVGQFTGTLLNGGSLKDAWLAATNPRQLVINGITGAIGYGVYQKLGVPLETYLEVKTGLIKQQVQEFNCGSAKKIGTQDPVDDVMPDLPEDVSAESLTEMRQRIIRENQKHGSDFETPNHDHFKTGASDAQNQITIKTYKGTRFRIDDIGTSDVTGRLILREYKSSANAPFTQNQRQGFQELYEGGGTVVGAGKGVYSGKNGGFSIAPGTRVTVVRPDTVRFFPVR